MIRTAPAVARTSLDVLASEEAPVPFGRLRVWPKVPLHGCLAFVPLRRANRLRQGHASPAARAVQLTWSVAFGNVLRT